MTAGRQGPASVFLYVDGYNLTAAKLDAFRDKTINLLDDKGNSLGDSWKERYPIGVRDVELAQEGAFFDTGTGGSHDALKASVPSSPQAAARLVCYGFAGVAVGDPFFGLEGAYTHEYEVVAEKTQLQRANTMYSVSGRKDEGVILQPLQAKTADWNTEGAESVDNGASSANGATAYLQVTAFSGFTGFIGKVRHSSDDISYADLITFANVTAAPNAQRLSVGGTVNRHLAFDGNVTGSGSITVFCGCARG